MRAFLAKITSLVSRLFVIALLMNAVAPLYAPSVSSEKKTEYKELSKLLGEKVYICAARLLKQESSILVMCKRADDKWSLVGIELDKKSKHFIHFVLKSYSSKDKAYQQFCSKDELTNFWSEGYANVYDIIQD
jgi:hypothetical protein